MKTIYMVVGCPGSGKSWVCEQLRDYFYYVAHDAFIKTPNTYLSAIVQVSKIATKPLLIETPFSMSQLLEPLEAHDFRIECVFIQEAEGVIEKRYQNREGKPIPPGHLIRQRTYLQRAIDRQAFRGTSTDVLNYLKAVSPATKLERYPWQT